MDLSDADVTTGGKDRSRTADTTLNSTESDSSGKAKIKQAKTKKRSSDDSAPSAKSTTGIKKSKTDTPTKGTSGEEVSQPKQSGESVNDSSKKPNKFIAGAALCHQHRSSCPGAMVQCTREYCLFTSVGWPEDIFFFFTPRGARDAFSSTCRTWRTEFDQSTRLKMIHDADAFPFWVLGQAFERANAVGLNGAPRRYTTTTRRSSTKSYTADATRPNMTPKTTLGRKRNRTFSGM